METPTVVTNPTPPVKGKAKQTTEGLSAGAIDWIDKRTKFDKTHSEALNLWREAMKESKDSILKRAKAVAMVVELYADENDKKLKEWIETKLGISRVKASKFATIHRCEKYLAKLNLLPESWTVFYEACDLFRDPTSKELLTEEQCQENIERFKKASSELLRKDITNDRMGSLVAIVLKPGPIEPLTSVPKPQDKPKDKTSTNTKQDGIPDRVTGETVTHQATNPLRDNAAAAAALIAGAPDTNVVRVELVATYTVEEFVKTQIEDQVRKMLADMKIEHVQATLTLEQLA